MVCCFFGVLGDGDDENNCYYFEMTVYLALFLFFDLFKNGFLVYFRMPVILANDTTK